MRESDAQMLITIFGGKDILASALGIAPYSDEMQTRILERFCECVFKRVLLCVPEEHIGGMIDAFEEHRVSGRTFDPLIDSLNRYVPNMDACVREEIERAVGEFRIKEAVKS